MVGPFFSSIVLKKENKTKTHQNQNKTKKTKPKPQWKSLLHTHPLCFVLPAATDRAVIFWLLSQKRQPVQAESASVDWTS